MQASASPDRLEIGKRLLGTALRALRNDRGLTLDEAARLTGLAPSYLSDIERGRTLPSLAALLAISDAYDERVSRLLDAVYPFGTTRRPRRAPEPPVDGRRR